MSMMITCAIADGALPMLQALRLRHLRYIEAHKDMIRIGGPTRAEDGSPQTMVIVLATDDPGEAERFIAAEPYNASRAVFASVVIRSWSQVLPEEPAGALAAAIEAQERSEAGR
jgi:uncharacterized protein YciI